MFGQKGLRRAIILKRIVALVVAVALMAPATALASGSSSCGSYNPPALCSVSANNAGTGNTAATAASTLPFTGLDAILLAAGGATLLGAGAVVRVLSRRMD
jgi:hypothetical protein